ncbi:MAG: NAD(P)-binding domain-containing protein, partial [Acidobacteriota bacterium]|nr:NAD(P)-binding domain-containing protein [Acidobacteriota bacterium]
MEKETCDIGLIGLAVMGQNLVLNMNDHGYKVAVFNRTVSKVDDFIQDEAKGTQVAGAHSIEELIGGLKKPRRVMLMVKAGDTVDKMIDSLVPHLEKGDILIDGGNSHYPDTTRRTKALAGKGILFIGTGVSGGEEGARFGPSIMPGGNPEAWPHVKEIFQSIAAKVEDGTPCCDWVGEDGAGHYVKMVHNGIEYGDMQLICEAYQLLKDGLGLNAGELHDVFAEWNKGELDSFLIDITSEIFAKNDEDGTPCCDWVGEDGAGHYVKMVHNGIEYGDMQLICEAYQLLKDGLGLSADDLHEVFADWNKGELDSFLIEITAEILAKKSDEDGQPMVDKILDTAGQKGTGKWTVISALDLGMPLTLIGEAVFARCLS